MANQLTSINVTDMRTLLDELDPYDVLVFSSDYGDHCHTEQVHTLEGNAEKKKIRESAYSKSGFEVLGEDDRLTGNEQTVVVIS